VWAQVFVVAVTLDTVVATAFGLVPELRGWMPVLLAVLGIELAAALAWQIRGIAVKSRARIKDTSLQ
jgi:hypothetical protein